MLLHSREVERLAEIGRWTLGQRYKAGACCRLGCKCRQDGGGLSALSNYGAIVARGGRLSGPISADDFEPGR